MENKKVLDSLNSNRTSNIRPQSKTIRLTLDLSKTDKHGCAIFNYQELIKAEKERLNIEQESRPVNGCSDRLPNEDEEALKKIALQYEEKYGGSSVRYQTYTELGSGYDESDSFIDNTEACEEGVPEDSEPKRGGFYVNSGKLEYKKVYDYTDVMKIKQRKRPLESESEENETSSEEKRTKNELKSKSEENENKTANGKNVKNKKLLTTLKKASEPENKETKKSDKNRKVSSGNINVETKDSNTNAETPAVATSMLETEKHDSKKETAEKEIKIITHTPTLENTLKQEINEKTSAEIPRETPESVINSESSNSIDRDILQKEEPPKLPELSPEILNIINRLKNFANTLNNSHRKYFTDATVSILLFRLESECRKSLSSAERHCVYSYLAHFLPCTKTTLVARIKKVFIGSNQLESYITQIKNIIANALKISDCYEQIRQSLDEARPILQKIVQIKVRQYVAMSTKKKTSFNTFIREFLGEILTLWPSRTISINNLLKIVNGSIKLEAETYKVSYTPEIALIKAVNSDEKCDRANIDLLMGESEPNVTIKTKLLTTINTSQKPKEDVLSNSKYIQKKTKNGENYKCEILKSSHHSGTKIDENDLKVKIPTKCASSDDKFRMQLDQVMHDLSILNQMSSDTTCSTSNK